MFWTRRGTRRGSAALVTAGIVALSISPIIAQTMIVDVPTAEEQIVVDGVLEPVWFRADSVSTFTQFAPFPGKPLSEPTTGYVLQDEKALYFAFRCQTGSRLPDCRTGSRDGRAGDYVVVYLDTFNDKKTAYAFSVTCAGVQGDAVLSENGMIENREWDGLFESAVSTSDSGYIVEMAIPWSTLHYRRNVSSWGLDIERHIPRHEEVGYLVPVKATDRFTISDFAVLQGIKPARKDIGLEVFPQAFFRTENSYGSVHNDFQGAIDVNWNITPSTRIQSTFNPDFSQIEADPFAFNLSKYDLYFDEKRPFFSEGREYFQPSGSVLAGQMELFYSRQVGKKLIDGSEVPIQAGVQTVGKMNRVDYAALMCHTAAKSYDGYFGPAEEQAAWFTVGRMKYQLSGISTIGMLYAGKHTDGSNNSVLSLDGTSSSRNMELTYQLAGSSLDGETDWAVNSFFFLHTVPYFFIKTGALHVGRDFNVSEIGYVPWNDFTDFSFVAGPVLYPKSGPVTYSNFNVGMTLVREYGETAYSREFTFSWETAFRNGWGLTMSYEIGKEIERDRSYNPKSARLYVSTDTSRKLWFVGSLSSWYGYNYARGFFARSEKINVYGSYRLSRQFSLAFNNDTWIEHRPDHRRKEITNSVRPNVYFSPVNQLVLKVFQETPFTRNGGVRSIRLGITLSYNFMPKSWVIMAFNDYQWRGDDEYKPIDRVFAIKFKHFLSW